MATNQRSTPQHRPRKKKIGTFFDLQNLELLGTTVDSDVRIQDVNPGALRTALSVLPQRALTAIEATPAVPPYTVAIDLNDPAAMWAGSLWVGGELILGLDSVLSTVPFRFDLEVRSGGYSLQPVVPADNGILTLSLQIIDRKQLAAINMVNVTMQYGRPRLLAGQISPIIPGPLANPQDGLMLNQKVRAHFTPWTIVNPRFHDFMARRGI